MPAWQNECDANVGVCKRLDRVIIFYSWVDSVDRFRSYIIQSTISDHMPICFQVELCTNLQKFPFKFNHFRLMDLEFVTMVRSTWPTLWDEDVSDAMFSLVTKVKLMKFVVSDWEKVKK